MKCLHCGYCCHHMMVVIVDNPKRGIHHDNLIIHDGDGSPCKHLRGDKPGEYWCAVHHYKWYKRTPCYSHGQIEVSPDDPCRMGEHILKKRRKNGKNR